MLILILAIPIRAPTTVANEQRETLLLAPEKNKQSLVSTIECCDILIACLVHFFSVIDLCNEKILRSVNCRILSNCG